MQTKTIGEQWRTAAAIQAAHSENRYVVYHAPRYARLLELLARYVEGPQSSVLDIGRSRLTGLIHESFDVPVNTLGFQEDGATPTGVHYHFDLNDAQHRRCWRTDIPTHDVIVMGEVIEHIHTSPRLVFGFLRTLLSPGGVLVLQTPNAVALHKRLQMLLGVNPFELIREDLTNPGHFREYTASELQRYAEMVKMTVEEYFFGNYFDYRYRGFGERRPVVPQRHLGLVNAMYRLMPGPLKPGITMVLRKPA